MRKLKSKKVKDNLVDGVRTLYDESINELEKLLADQTAFKIFMYFLSKDDEEVASKLSGILAKVTFYSKIKNRTEKFQRGLVVRQEVMKLIRELALKVKPTKNLVVFTTLFELNELLSSYTQYENRMLKALENSDKKNDYPAFREIIKGATGSIVEGDISGYLGYEPVFLGVTQSKLLDVLNWLPKSIERLIKYNPEFFVPESLENLMADMYSATQKIIEEKGLFSSEVVEHHGKECELFYQFIIRTSLVDKSLDELEEINKTIYPTEYKSDMRHLRSTVSRLKTVFDRLYQLIEYGEIREVS